MSLTKCLTLSVVFLCSCGRQGPPGLFEQARLRLAETLQHGDFLFYSQDMRVQAVDDLIRGIRHNYSLLPLKKDLIGLDFEAFAFNARKAELDIKDVDGKADRAAANMAFLDRARVLSASFKDTHFRVSPSVPLPPITLGLHVARVSNGVGGQTYIVAGVSPQVMAAHSQWAGSDDFKKIQVGYEILEYDGKPVAEAIKELEPYVSASSDLGRETYATAALGNRNFRYPEKNHVDIKLLSPGGETRILRFAWVYKSSYRADVMEFFRNHGYADGTLLDFSWDKEKSDLIERPVLLSGAYAPALSMKGILEQRDFKASADASPALRTGYVTAPNGRAYALLQVFTFDTDKVKDADAKELEFFAVIRSFLKEANQRNLSLILDLRNNGGGHGSYPAMLMSLLAPAGAVYRSNTIAFRNTPYTQELIDAMYSSDFASEVLGQATAPDMERVVREAVEKGLPVTSSVSTNLIKADRGFNHPIVALVGPQCVSACDIMSWLLKENHRAKLLGQPTSGTGAGFYENKGLFSTWKDTDNVLVSRIPNFLFGRPGPTAGDFVFDNTAELNTEQRPAQPDLAYASTQQDISEGEQGWITKAAELLNSPSSP